ncbi:cytochrome P450 monooxygenase pc-bph [Mycena rosella]|uniref:Cytochrome P450 monooxygenase pc-bph n=1 Tax=Mycena rosella TaxID=1033263 RepID=A0AAD7DZQ8_MYCRO|nr:cytochrome P450 monooxygenase pc-bph [Mycena rosella]
MLILTLDWASWTFAVIATVVALIGYLLLLYLRDPHRIRQYPGPFLAKITYAWLLGVVITRRRSQIIHEMHKKYGPIIRITPSEISFSSPEAYYDIHSASSKVTKSAFYDAFASIGLSNVFTARSKIEHGQKRKLLHSLFTAEVSRELSGHTQTITSRLLDEWSTRYVSDNECTWFDCVPWISFLAFDTISDFIFGESFGMIRASSDIVTMPKDVRLGTISAECTLQKISLIKVVSKREAYNYFVGVLPSWWKAVGRRVLRSEAQASKIFSDFVAHRLVQRLSQSSTEAPHDLVGRFLKKSTTQNETFPRDSLIAELITILVAGSDTTRNSLIAAIYYLAKSTNAQRSLQNELDAHMTSATPAIGEIEALPFLGACLNETLRLYSPVPIGLPRTVPASGMVISGDAFVGGTTVGVPIYTIHRDESVWGPRPEEFRPERWLDDGRNSKAHLHAFKPFSEGPASCIGKHLALMQLRLMIAAIFKRFDVALEDPTRPLRVEDWFVRRVTECRVGIRPR